MTTNTQTPSTASDSASHVTDSMDSGAVHDGHAAGMFWGKDANKAGEGIGSSKGNGPALPDLRHPDGGASFGLRMRADDSAPSGLRPGHRPYGRVSPLGDPTRNSNIAPKDQRHGDAPRS